MCLLVGKLDPSVVDYMFFPFITKKNVISCGLNSVNLNSVMIIYAGSTNYVWIAGINWPDSVNLK